MRPPIKRHIHYVQLTFQFQKQDDGRWTAECVELGTATYADSLEQAQKELIELVELHLNGLEDAGERERFFQDNKIQMVTLRPTPETSIRVPTDPRIFSQSYVKEFAEAY